MAPRGRIPSLREWSDTLHCAVLITLQTQSAEVISFWPTVRVCHQNKGALEGEPVIAVTGSGQNRRPPPVLPAPNTLMGPNQIRGQDKLVRARLSPPLPTANSPPNTLNPGEPRAFEVCAATSGCLWRRGAGGEKKKSWNYFPLRPPSPQKR